MAATKAWTGSLEVSGFPIHLVAYPVQKSSESNGFKMLDPKHKSPVTQVLVDVKGKTVARDQTLRGAVVGKDVIPLTEQQVEQINTTLRTTEMPVDRFSPVDTIPLFLAQKVYYVIPDPKVDGAAKPAGIVWNGLRASGLAYVTEWVKKDGAKPAPVALVADGKGILAYEFQYVGQTYERPEWAPEVDEKAAATFSAFTEATATVEPFSLAAFEDTYAARKAEVVSQAIAGKLPAKPAEGDDPAAEPVPDLMAALEASVQAAQKPKATQAKGRQGRPGGRGPEAAAKRKAGQKKAAAARKEKV